jgi:hypothetical protein
MDNLALGIRGIAVEDDASLSHAPLHPPGPYTAFSPPEYG